MFHQLIRTIDGVKETFPDPIIQNDRHELQLKKWLAINKFPEIPVLSLVIISNPSTMIQASTENKKLPEQVIHRDYLPTKIFQLEEIYQDKVLSEKSLKKLKRKLKNQHTPPDISILERFQVTRDQLLKGVHCSKCGHLPINRIFGTWYCPKCAHKCKNAHITAFKDYFLLIGSDITNSGRRDFLGISSEVLMNRLLKQANVPYTGANKGRIYQLTFSFNELPI